MRIPSVNWSLAGFFNLPELQRYRFIAGAGGLFLLLSGLARFSYGESVEISMYTRMISVASIFIFVFFGHKFHLALRNPHLAVLIALAPLLGHLALMLYMTKMGSDIAIACLVISAVVTLSISSTRYQRLQVISWTTIFVATAWSIPEPALSPLTFSFLLATVSTVLYLLAASFHSARLELEQKDGQLATAQTFAGIGGWEHDFETGLTHFSETAFDILKFELDTDAPMDVEPFLVLPIHESKLAAGLTGLMQKGIAYDIEEQVRTGDGELIWIHARGTPVYRRGTLVGAMGVFSNITQRVEYEQELLAAKEIAEAAVVSRNQFIANMSHEIRTPLNGVIGMASVLKASDLSHEDLQSIDTIISCGESLLAIINDILDFAKLDAKKVNLETIAFDLRGVVDHACDTVRKSIEDKNVELSLDVFDTRAPLLGDPNRLRQVLTNLLSNATKFTARGEISVRVECVEEVEEVVTLRFSVRDSGIGITQEAQETLFQAFTQADSSTTRLFGGTGLGLAISARLVAEMGGDLVVESEPDRGSTFSFALELEREALTPQRERVPADEPLSELAHDLKILLAEDNLVNQKVAMRMLSKLGYQAAIANNGQEAVDLVQASEYDLVLMDLQMPVLDGLDATKTIRQLTDIQQPHICALTANAMAEDQERCQLAGMDDFLAKPVRLQDLKRVLTEMSP